MDIVTIVFTYLISSIAIFLAAARLTNASSKDCVQVFVFSVGLGPLSISWILETLFALLPHHSDLFYVSIIYALFSAAFVVFSSQLKLLRFVPAEIINFRYSQLSRANRVLLLVVLVTLTGLFALCLISPLNANDPLLYTEMARELYQKKDVSIYPFITPGSDLYLPVTHPLGYHMLIVWNFMLQGNQEFNVSHKLIAPFFALCTSTLLWYLLSRKNVVYGFLGCLLFLTTPLYFSHVSIFHIDSLRIHTFFLALAALPWATDKGDWRSILLLGIVLGMALYSHNLGLLILPVFLVLFLISPRLTKRNKLKSLILISIVILLMVGPRYLKNYLSLHTLATSDNVVWSLESLRWNDYTAVTRGIQDIYEKLVNGIFRGLSDYKHFGITYWLFLGSLVFFRKEAMENASSKTILQVVLLFYALIALTLIAGKDVIIKNSRYLLTVQPFIAYHGSIFLGRLYEKILKA